MADVVSRISTLPGSFHDTVNWCDNHPNVKAVVRVQGETDSMGAELHDFCEECKQAHLRYERSEEARTGQCDWCKANVKNLQNTRDFEEGLYGPVYRVCSDCIDHQRQRAREDLDSDDSGDWD